MVISGYITPVMYSDALGFSADWSWSTFWKATWMTVASIGAIIAAIGVLSVAVLASPLMLIVAGVT